MSKLLFCRKLFIERRTNAPQKFFRLSEGREVRLRYAYLITCQKAVKNEQGEVVELHCTYDPATKGGSTPDGRKVKGTIHWGWWIKGSGKTASDELVYSNDTRNYHSPMPLL